jgi:hypothetical protein
MGGICSTHGIDTYKILVGNPEEKNPPWRTVHRWEDDTRIDVR